MDPAARLPAATSQVSTDATVAVLRAPPDTALALEVVHRFFRAVVEESPGDLEDLLTKDASTTVGIGAGDHPARSSWRARLARLDYGAVAHQVVYRPSELEAYQKVGNIPPKRQSGSLPLAIAPENLLLRVPIVTPRSGSTRLFGDEMWFLLEPGPNGYRIAKLVENFQLP